MIASAPTPSKRRMATGSSTIRTPMMGDMPSRSKSIGMRPILTGTCARNAAAQALGGRTPALPALHLNRALSIRQANTVVTLKHVQMRRSRVWLHGIVVNVS